MSFANIWMSRLLTAFVQTRRRLYIIPEGVTWRKDSVIGTISYLNNNNNNNNKNDVDDDDDNDACNNYYNNQVFLVHLENSTHLQY